MPVKADLVICSSIIGVSDNARVWLHVKLLFGFQFL